MKTPVSFRLTPQFALLFLCCNFSALPVEHSADGTVSINGIEMYYKTFGAGEPLLLLHGFNSSHESWRDFIPPFAGKYQVITPDLRGHGRSTNPSNEFTHRQSAKDIQALLDHLKIKKVRAIGISTGGMTLLHLATQDPDRLQDMVLIGATIYFPEEARRIMRRSTVESLTPKDIERMAKSMFEVRLKSRPSGGNFTISKTALMT